MAKIRCREVVKDGKIFVEEIHKLVVYRFRMGDVEDPQLFAAQPIYEWQQTEAGKFVMEHAIDEPVFHTQLDHVTYGYQCAIVAEMKARHVTEYLLRFK